MSTPVAVPSVANQHRTLLGLLFFGFFLTGIATVIVGPILPTYIRRWALNDMQAGFFFTVQFLASLAGTILSSAINSRWGYRYPLVAGYLCLAAGFATLNTGTHEVALLAVGLLGFGYGLVVPGTNMAVAETSGARSASMLNLLNSAWGAGAVLCSPLILVSVRLDFLSSSFLVCAALNFSLAASFTRVSFSDDHVDGTPQVRSGSPIPTAGVGLAVVIALMFFIYVGTETAVGGWSAEHAKRLAGASALGTIAPMFFYGGLTFGRGIAPWLLSKFTERILVLGSLSLVIAGVLLTIFSTNLFSAIASVAVAGLGCAVNYPTYIAWFSRWFGARAKALSIVMFSLGSIGGAVIPALVGVVSQRAASLRVGLMVPLAGAAGLMVIVALLRRDASQ
jgi:MFS transporter, FHS family, glucose/mannose:H+ symporter